ncbi:MAG: ATP phosphoribosyltransferase regulatory subunit [Deferrisomatales bacterium]
MSEPTRPRPELSGRHRELPAGLGDILPGAASRLFALRRRLLAVMGRWGYRPVVPPLMEFGEVFTRALADPAQEVALCKLVDRTTGHVLAIRPDFTPQVARIVATRFREATAPLRLCYEGSVLRHVPARKGRSREQHQVGAELIGVVDPEADAEAIAVAIACLREAGLTEFKVDVGQVEFFRGVLQGVDLPDREVDALTRAVARKDLSELGRRLEGVRLSDSKKRLLAELPLLAGGVEVIERASELVESDHSRAALDNLSRVVGFVEIHGLTEHLTVDLGELRGIDYHTGVIFEAFVPHMGIPLCRGGRYDALVGRYGTARPATGFSLDLVALLEALTLQEGGSAGRGADGVFIVNFRADRVPALDLARRLRAAGVPASRDLIRRPLADSLTHARQQGFRWAAVLGAPGKAEDQVVLVDLNEGTESLLTTDRVLERALEE